MIYLKISGRCGNQFFQYAYVQKYIDENCPDEIMNISFEYLKEKKTDNNTFVNVLSDFNIKKINVLNKIPYNNKQKILDFYYRLLYKLIRINAKIRHRSLQKKDFTFLCNMVQKKLNVNGLYYYIPTMKKFYKSKTDNIIFFGSYEDNKSMEEYRNEILNYYKINSNLNDDAQEIRKIALNSNSVCITIRRGDFLSNKYKKNFYICNEQYFENAIKKMNLLISNPQYIVFSDDVEWCKKNVKFPKNTIYENRGNSIVQKIDLMSSCKNFIISNSTFSWWVQFLSEFKDKKVIAPKKWNNFEFMDEIYCKDWILM